MTEPLHRVAVVDSHPIQYHAPWFRALSERCDLTVFFAHRQTPEGQAEAGYDVAFEWDVDILSGFQHEFLRNVSADPNVFRFGGCDTPEVAQRLTGGDFECVILTGWYLKSYLQALWACRRANIPVLVRGDSRLETPRSLSRRLAKEVVYRALMRQFDGFLTVGQHNRAYLRHYGARARDIFPSPHFVDNAYFREHADSGSGAREKLRAALGTEPNAHVVLFVGRLSEVKHPMDLLAAIETLHRRDPGKWHLAVVGSGPAEDRVRGAARDRKLPVSMLGFRNQSELPVLYGAADVLVLPSVSETWGLVVNEAMASGLPVVVSDGVGCAPDLVEPDTTGLVYPFGDTWRLAECIARMAPRRRDPEVQAALRAKMAAFDCDAAVAGTLQAVAHVCRGRVR